MRKITNNGSITVEAAFILPVFLIGVLTIGFLMKFLFLQEAIVFQLCKEARISIRQSVFLDQTLLFPLIASYQIEEEDLEMDFFMTSNFRYPEKRELTDKMVYYEGLYYQKIPFPIQLYKGLPGKENLLFRPFAGQTYSEEALSPEKMEESEESFLVWIFPRAGERYHQRECGVIVVYPSQVLLSDEVKKHYRPCQHCLPDKEKEGNLVYCFPRAGEAYHRQSCALVKRYVVEIEKEEAVRKGYSPCKLCGGS